MKLFDHYFYGRPDRGDYTDNDQPKTRVQLFFQVLRVRWGGLIGLNLLYLLFWLPAVAWTFLCLTYLEQNYYDVDFFNVLFTYFLLLCPLVTITGPANTGVGYVLRNWARDEHSFVRSDFWDAVKANWKQGLVVSTISGFLPYLLYVGYTFYGSMAASKSLIFMIPIALLIMVFIMWKLSEMCIYTMMVTYELKTKDLIRNALLLTIGKLPLAVGIKLLTWVFPIIAIAVMLAVPTIEPQVLLVLGLLYLIYLPGFNRLITSSYANALCEKYMNAQIGAPTNIGLRPDDWDDTEYRPEDDE